MISSFSFYDEKLKRCAKEIEKLQHELSSYIDTNAELQFQLSTLKFLEQQAEHEYHKIEEFNDAKVLFEKFNIQEKEKQEILNKLNKSLKDLKEQQEINHSQQIKIKELEEGLQECNEKLTKEQNQRDTWKKEIEFFQNENRVLKQMNEEKGTIKMSRELSSESPSQDNVRKITQLEKLQFELNDWKEKYFNEKKERERQTGDHQDLVIKKLKEQEEYQSTIRQWQTKYDQLNKQIDEKEEILDEKTKEINYLQQKMYQIKDQQDQEIQTEDQNAYNSNQNSVSINVALVDEYDEQIIKTFKFIQNSKIETIQDFCQSKEQDEENPLKLEISRIIKDAIHKLPRYAEIQILKLEQHIEMLEKQVTYVHSKWRRAVEENRRNSVSKVKVKKTQSHSLPDLEIPQDLCQINDEKLKELIHTLRNKQTQLKSKISLLQAQIQFLDLEKQDLLLQLEKKDKEQALQLQQCQRQLTKHQSDYEKLHDEYQKSQSIKNRLKEKNNEMITDMAEFTKEVGVKNEIIADYKIKLEEVQKRYDGFLQEIERLREEIRQKEQEIRSKELEIKQKEQVIEDLERENFEGEKQISNFQEKLEGIQQNQAKTKHL
ncbi:hypothetical protein pb186bvf_007604 [Paramecium bursaria]